MLDPQKPFDVAVVIPTILRPNLGRAVESVFNQDLDGSIQILIGVDKAIGDTNIIRHLITNCPDNIHITVINPNYSTSARHGGVYSCHFGGAIRTILSYLANSRYVAYLDDDNWYQPNHLSSMLDAVSGYDWAFSLRNYADSSENRIIAIDQWESLGPDAGIFKDTFGGFCDTSTLIMEKASCHMIFPLWALSLTESGDGEDRLVLSHLIESKLSYNSNNMPTCNYTIDPNDGLHEFRKSALKNIGINIDSLRNDAARIITRPKQSK